MSLPLLPLAFCDLIIAPPLIRREPRQRVRRGPTGVSAKDADHNSPSENAARYRRLADEADVLATATLFQDSREAYLRCAREWRGLADELEKRTEPWSFWRWVGRIFRAAPAANGKRS